MSPLGDERRALCVKYARLAGGASRPWRHAHRWLYDEIEGAANLALVRAAASWDESSGIAFASYAFSRIRRASRAVVDLEYRGAAGREGGADLVPDPAPPGWTRVDDDDALGAMLAPLPARDRDVLRMTYRAGLNCSEIAGLLGLRRETVSRIRSKALKTLALTPGLHI